MTNNFDKWIDAAASVTPDTSAYTAGDSVGGAMTFDVGGSSTGGGLINNLIVYDDDGEGAAGALWLFKANLVTPIADQAAFGVVLADLANLIDIITLPAFTTIGALKVAVLPDLGDKFQVTGGKIYGYFVCSATPTYAAAKTLRFVLGIQTQ